MAKWLIYDMLTNVSLSGSQIIATTATGSDNLEIGDFITNGHVKEGELCVTPGGSHSRYLTYGDALTNISLDSNGNVNVNDHIAEIDHTAEIAGKLTNIQLDSIGRIIVAAGGTNDTVIEIGDSISNAYRDSNNAIILADLSTSLSNLLLEDGNDLLQENGSYILL